MFSQIPAAWLVPVVTLTLGGSPAIGVLPVYVAGSRYQVSAAGSLAQTAQAIADVVNADWERQRRVGDVEIQVLETTQADTAQAQPGPIEEEE